MIEYFEVLHTPSRDVYFRFYDPSTDKVFDFYDNTWKASLGACTDPELNTSEVTTVGDATYSYYVTSYDLALIYNEADVKLLLVQAIDESDYAYTDTIIADGELKVANGSSLDSTLSAALTEELDKRIPYAGSGICGSGSDGASVVLSASPPQGTNEMYRGMLLVITSGDARGRAVWVSGYDSSTTIATVSPPITEAVLAGDTWAVLPFLSPWEDLLASHDTTGTEGAALALLAAGLTAEQFAEALYNYVLTDETGTLATAVANVDRKLSVLELNIRGGTKTLESIGTQITTQANLTGAAAADAVFDESAAGHTGALATIAARIDQTLTALGAAIRGTDSDTLKILSGQLDDLMALSDCDVVVVTTGSPWYIEFRAKGTATVLLTKYLYQTDGTPITSADQLVGQQLENEL